ncbi:Uncharacterised protein [Mycobacteroides abscessus subsp. abscessus]|nr:Uncharacterised protein [Mycobacteroides abscessus subsp. abscessus]SIE40804.1 Uncharacterised protein [Mycobacteroides abscessus subsp. abscessus]
MQPDALAAIYYGCGLLEGIAALPKGQPTAASRGREHQVLVGAAGEFGFQKLRQEVRHRHRPRLLAFRGALDEPLAAHVRDGPSHPDPLGGGVHVGHCERRGLTESQAAVTQYQDEGPQAACSHGHAVQLFVCQVPLIGLGQCR